MKTYTNAEAVELLTKNPKLEFELKDGEDIYILTSDGSEIYIIDKDGIDYHSFCLNDKWTLRETNVYYCDAFNAFKNGNDIKCIYMDQVYYYNCKKYGSYHILEDNNGHPVSVEEIFDGKWYIVVKELEE